MLNDNSFLASSGVTAVAVIVSVLSIVFLLGSVLFIWWVDTKKRPFKEFWKIVGDKMVFIWNDISGLFRFRTEVKTVYSDKTLNYSGTEFLPIPTKAPTNQYTYEFVGWDKNGIDENGNIVTDGDQVEIGGNDRYIAMCWRCWNDRIKKQNNR